MSRTRKLDPIEIRVLGALLEKEQTTPEQYPMTANALIAACNQKSNRDPVMSLTETDVVEALDRLREDVLVWRTMGARTERWQHSLDRRWELNRRTKAIMTLLLLRGPQTAGELRARSERMHSFESIAEVEEALRSLAEGFDALVCELPRQPGKRETRWMHLESTEGDPREVYAADSPPPPPAAARVLPEAAAAPRRSPYDERLERLEESVDDLRSMVEELTEQVRSLREDLGVA